MNEFVEGNASRYPFLEGYTEVNLARRRWTHAYRIQSSEASWTREAQSSFSI